jgi:DNA-binding CsgD family transcriptional regulator
MILCDLPYGTTACKWDTIIPFEPLWKEYKRIIKDNGAIVLFGSEPFSSYLRMSNIKDYKYDWIWNKRKAGNIFLAKYQPMKIHEIISVFNSNIFYPIKTPRDKIKTSKNYGTGESMGGNKEKENKIIENVVFSNEVNRFLAKLLHAIKSQNTHVDAADEKNEEIPGIAEEIEAHMRAQGWQKYSNDYEKIHPAYQKRLLKIHPALTPTELKLSAMIRLGLSIKELAGMMFITPESMRVARSRLRKKLGLSSEQNLQTYLSAI